MKKGFVYLVGSGPGDEGLITIRGRELIERADVIVYDRLGTEGFLGLAKSDCELIDAGKQPGKHSILQDGINNIICQKASEGKQVVRLKGGDPFVFGRGGEEALALCEADIPFEVVPGVSSFYASCAYAGIPVTHRGLSASVHVFTGHGASERGLDFDTIAALSGTIMFVMAIGNLDYICTSLIASGKAKNTPTAIIQWGTTYKQKKITGQLCDIARLASENEIGNPAIVVIGEVVTLNEKLGWQKYRTLWGKRILLTGRQETAKEAAEILKEAGAAVTVWTSGISEITHNHQLNLALRNIQDYSWIFFTSALGVASFFSHMSYENMDVRKLANIKIFCIGEKTAMALRGRGLYADYVPKKWSGKATVNELCRFIKTGDRILFPASNLADVLLENEAKRLGAAVHRVTAYTTRRPDIDNPPLGDYDAIGFFSPSQVDGLWHALGGNFGDAKLFPIGEATANAITNIGKTPQPEAIMPTSYALAQTILKGLS